MTINNRTISTSSLMSESSGGTSLRSKAGYSSRKVPNSASSRARSTQSGNTTALSSLDDLAESVHVSQDPLRDAINEDSSTNFLDRKRDIERNADETMEGRATRSPHYPEDDRSTWVQRSGKAIGGNREIRSGGNRIRSAGHKLAAVTSVSRAVLGKEKTVVKEARDIEKSIQEVIKAVEKVGSSIVRTNVELSEPEKREYKNGGNLQRLTGSNHSTERFSLRKTKEQASKHVVNRRNPLYGFLIESKQIDDFFTSVLGYIEVYLAFIDLQSNRFKTINDRTRGLNIQYLPERVVAYLFEAAVDADIHRSSHNSQKPTLGSSVSSTSLQNTSSPKSAKSRDTVPFASTASEQSDNDRKRALKEVGLRYSLLLLYGHHLLSDTNLIRDLEKKRSTAVVGCNIPKSHFPPSKKEITKDWNIRPKTAPAKLEAGDTSSIERDCFEQVYAIAEEIVRLRFFPFVMQKAPSPLWKCVRIELDRIFRGRFFSAKAAEVDVQVNPETAYSTSNYLEPSEKTDIMLAERGARRASEASLKWTELANRPATAPVKAQGIRGVGIKIRPSSGGLRGNRMKLSIFRVVDSRSDASISLLPKQTGRQFALASSPAGKSTKSIISTNHVL